MKFFLFILFCVLLMISQNIILYCECTQNQLDKIKEFPLKDDLMMKRCNFGILKIIEKSNYKSDQMRRITHGIWNRIGKRSTSLCIHN
jgi:hypothetical protein